LSNDNSIMFMWATMPRLDFAIELMKSRWFEYKTVAFTWVKTNKDWTYRVNPWYYTASNIELVIVWIKWENKWRFKPAKTMINQIVAEWLREHSRKPDEVRARIELLYPNLDKVELFARTESKWRDVLWNEIDKF
jgi:site-specific DNA-methyltransferase (adenine-specific)